MADLLPNGSLDCSQRQCREPRPANRLHFITSKSCARLLLIYKVSGEAGAARLSPIVSMVGRFNKNFRLKFQSKQYYDVRLGLLSI